MRIMQKKMVITIMGLYRDYMGMMGKKMGTTIMGFRGIIWG